MFVKNLSFSTTEAGLRTCFEKAGLQVRSVSIPRKKGPGASEATLSMGFGFVECADASLVEKSLKVSFLRFVVRRGKAGVWQATCCAGVEDVRGGSYFDGMDLEICGTHVETAQESPPNFVRG